MIVLGIDPGIAIMGYGILEYDKKNFKIIDYGAITTSSDMQTYDRLKYIYKGVDMLIKTAKPDCAAVEELFYFKNKKTIITVSEARGAAITACANNGLEVFEYTPLQVKQAVVGYGNADKKQVQFMVRALLNLKQMPKPDDIADALAVSICHCHSLNARERGVL
ncbi:crossover junction endodeoxyribonuclease RuvC [Calorimonas adulescens]|uniref:Crossover junction endodeoxyribonuclease RuvC n=1 Tax=Calorimonas adulescens TaxID=2606906 RepID=A0A5D8QHC0_9THEO|nr:crossover junction endodeoxyribonuclease RuvC [Calorimonas adulescens]TZE83649.1 crossover junction endodeoxyribonuclease RuvC [Calorimonas adulescens]